MAKIELRDGAIGMDVDSDDAEAIRESGPGLRKAREDAEIFELPGIIRGVKLSAKKASRKLSPPVSPDETPVGSEFRLRRERFYRLKAETAAREARERDKKTSHGKRSSPVHQGRVRIKNASDRAAPYVARHVEKERPNIVTPLQEHILELFEQSVALLDQRIMAIQAHPEHAHHINEQYGREKIRLFLRSFDSLTSEDMTAKNVTTLLRAWLQIHFNHAEVVENLGRCAASLILLRKEGRKMDDVLKAISCRAPQSPAIDDSRNLYTMGFANDESNSGDPETELHYIGPSLDAPEKYSEEPETDLPEYEPPDDMK